MIRRFGLFILSVLMFASFSQAQTPTLTRIGAFPQIASGSGWKTSLDLINPSTQGIVIQVVFYPDAPTASFPGTTQGVMNAIVYPGDSFLFEMEDGPMVTGWAEVFASAPLSGFSIFRYRAPGQPDMEGTAVLDTGLNSARVIIPFDNTNGYRTGVAVADISNWTPSGDGAVNGLVAYAANGKFIAQTFRIPGRTFFLDQLYRDDADHGDISDIQGMRGYIVMSGVTAIALRFGPNGSFTSMPIVRP